MMDQKLYTLAKQNCYKDIIYDNPLARPNFNLI